MKINRILGFLLLATLVAGALALYQRPLAMSPLATTDGPIGTLGDDALTHVSNTQRIVTANLGRKVNLSRGTCGFTMTIQRLYADPERIILGYTLIGPASHAYIDGLGAGKPDVPVLTDAQGHHFPMIVEFFGRLAGNAEGQVLEFDGRGISNWRHTLTLHLMVPTIQMNELSNARTLSCRSIRYTPVSLGVRTVTVGGPFTYDFTVSVAPMRVTDLHALARVDGVTVTLARLEVTAISTQLSMHVAPAGRLIGMAELAMPDPVRRVAAISHLHLNAIIHGKQALDVGKPMLVGSSWIFDFDAPFTDYHDTATLVLSLYRHGTDREPVAGGVKTFALQFPT